MAAQTLEPQHVPVGAVLAYAGQLDATALTGLGWLLCFGQAIDRSIYGDLETALGGAYGSDANGNSYVPDLRGYFLRGLDPTGTVDPDADARTAFRPGANFGASVGSYQSYATAKPTTAFQGNVPQLSDVAADDHQAWGDYCVDASTGTISSTAGGDPETVPVNKSVRWIIKAADIWNGMTVLPPVGTVAATAATTGAANTMWSACDGSVVPPTSPSYALLNAVLGTLHGTSPNGVVLPDLRGYFLRGCDDSSGRDKCLGHRTYPGGPSIDVGVGSVQSWYTAAPSASFETPGFKYPNGHIGNVFKGTTQAVYVWDHTTTLTIPLSDVGGGDAESRPVNVAVDFLVCDASVPPVDDGFDIGMIVAVLGNGPAPSASFWLLCDGSPIPSQFGALVAALGKATSVPDLRGRFLRGLDTSGTVDKDGAARTVGSAQGFATGRPQLSNFVSYWPHWPNATWKTFGVTGGTFGPPTNEVKDTCTAGGDKETRPINVAVNFFIKAANGS